jgi:hypothetical protein
MRRPQLLPDTATVPNDIRRVLQDDYERFARSGLPDSLEAYISEVYRIDLTAEYAGFELRNPWGKASGQLSMTARQVDEDVAAGLAFVVLKTVIAQDESGRQTMEAWAVKESRMVAERILGQSGETGWTISWKGRGWWHSFDDYLDLIRESQQIARGTGTLIVPSCKFHLPTSSEDYWNVAEYRHTTPRLLEAWREHAENPAEPMPLEKDFSPTLAGSERSTEQQQILKWLHTVPRLVQDAVANDDGPSLTGNSLTQPPLRLGLKIFNALFDDDFQLDMLREIHSSRDDSPDYFIYGNRLFDPNRQFDGHRGIAYGGPDLSDRNLRVMRRFQKEAEAGAGTAPLLRWSATGNITTGKMALQYALLGASSFQLHTFFQLPADQYRMTGGSKTEKALHELYFHPATGLIVWMRHLAGVLNLPSEPFRFLDVVGKARLLPALNE